jgi:hypothetical protein
MVISFHTLSACWFRKQQTNVKEEVSLLQHTQALTDLDALITNMTFYIETLPPEDRKVYDDQSTLGILEHVRNHLDHRINTLNSAEIAEEENRVIRDLDLITLI